VGIVAGAQLLRLKEVVAFVSARWNALHCVLWRLADVAVLVILVLLDIKRSSCLNQKCT
jgi:hypothetical protein